MRRRPPIVVLTRGRLPFQTLAKSTVRAQGARRLGESSTVSMSALTVVSTAVCSMALGIRSSRMWMWFSGGSRLRSDCRRDGRWRRCSSKRRGVQTAHSSNMFMIVGLMVRRQPRIILIPIARTILVRGWMRSLHTGI